MSRTGAATVRRGPRAAHADTRLAAGARGRSASLFIATLVVLSVIGFELEHRLALPDVAARLASAIAGDADFAAVLPFAVTTGSALPLSAYLSLMVAAPGVALARRVAFALFGAIAAETFRVLSLLACSPRFLRPGAVREIAWLVLRGPGVVALLVVLAIVAIGLPAAPSLEAEPEAERRASPSHRRGGIAGLAIGIAALGLVAAWLAPTPAQVQVNVADALAKGGLAQQALGRYERALALDATEPRAALVVAGTRLAAGRAAEAERITSAALAAHPRVAELWFVAGNARAFNASGQLLGPGFDVRAARDAFAHVLAIDPSHPRVHETLAALAEYDDGGVHFGPGAPLADAIAELRLVTAATPTVSAWTSLGVLLAKTGSPVDARAAYDAAQALAPDDAALRARLDVLRRSL